MALRPDITAAAATLTAAFDMRPELRQLGALLPEDEIVHRLVAGVYGGAGGLLAVTNRRVLLLRGGQASEGCPLERLVSVRWLPGTVRGTIAITEVEDTVELTQVEPVTGVAVVKLIRSLIPQVEYADDYGEYDELADAGEDALLTHCAPAMSGATRSQGRGEETTAAPGGRFAVKTKLRPPRDASPRGARSESAGLVPEQKTAAERSMPTHVIPRAETSRASKTDIAATGGRRCGATGSIPNGAVSVRALNRDSQGDHQGKPQGDSSRSTYLSEQGTNDHRRSGRYVGAIGGHSAVPTVRTTAASAALGSPLDREVPVRTLAEETSGTAAVPRLEENHDAGFGGRRSCRVDDRRSGRPNQRGGRVEDNIDDSPRRRRWLWIGRVAAGVAALGAIGGVVLLHHSDSPAAVDPAPAASDPLAAPVVQVTKVIDGETIEVSGLVTGQVEVIGISAPRSDKGQCGANASTAFATRTLSGSHVTLLTDPSQPATDRSGRKLASLRTDNGSDYAVLAAGAGMARYYDGGTPVAQAKDINNAQAEAKKAQRGLWGSPCHGKLTTHGSESKSTAKGPTASKVSTSNLTRDKPASTSSESSGSGTR